MKIRNREEWLRKRLAGFKRANEHDEDEEKPEGEEDDEEQRAEGDDEADPDAGVDGEGSGDDEETISQEIEAEIEANEDGSYTLSFSSEMPIQHWFGTLTLDHSTEDAVDLSRLNDIGVLLFNHNMDRVLGKIARAWVDTAARKCRAQVMFDDEDPDTLAIANKVRKGILKGASMWFDVDELVLVREAENGPNEYRSSKWKVFEVSIASVPADPTVGVGRSLPRRPASSAAVTAKPGKTSAKHERARVAGIMRIAQEAGFLPEETAELVSGKKSINDARALAYKRITDRERQNGGVVRMGVIHDAADKKRTAITNALLLRAGHKVGATEAAAAREFMGQSVYDLARDAVVAGGGRVSGLSRYEVAKQALFRSTNYNSTSDFPLILGDFVRRVLNQAYIEAQVTYPLWTRSVPVPDLRTTTGISLQAMSSLAEVKEGAEYTYAKLAETGESYRLAKFGKMFTVTVEMLINDDLNAISRIPALFASASRRTVNANAYAALLTPTLTMSDGIAIFHANHKNLAGTAAALSVNSLGAGRKAMRTQKAGDATLNIAPAHLLVPSSLETTAQTLINSTSDPAQANPNVINPMAGKLQIICDAEMDSYSATGWYLAANANDIPTVDMGFLGGNDAPELDTFEDIARDGMSYRVRIFNSAKLMDYRGVYKNAGA